MTGAVGDRGAARFENRGYGKRLMALVEAWLLSVGRPETGLTTDPNEVSRAVGFYRRLGWRDGKFENGDRFMRKVRPRESCDTVAPVGSSLS